MVAPVIDPEAVHLGDQYAEVWKALETPFDASEIKTRAQNGMQFRYVDARAVEQRLNSVVGYEGWSNHFELVFAGQPYERQLQSGRTLLLQHVAVKCSLTVLGITKEDFGEADSENDPFKGAASDALKRAALQFGVGRHLWEEAAEQRQAQQGGRQGGWNNNGNSGGFPRQAPAPQGPTPLRNAPAPSNGGAHGGPEASDAQKNYIATLGGDQGLTTFDLNAKALELYGAEVDGLSKQQASGFISFLKE